MQGDIGEPTVAARRYSGAYWPLTNFYPQYDGANDQVDRVTAVRAVRFQRILPRYQLSTSETRDEGVGPTFDGAILVRGAGSRTEVSAGAGAPAAGTPAVRGQPARGLPPWMGTRVDTRA